MLWGRCLCLALLWVSGGSPRDLGGVPHEPPHHEHPHEHPHGLPEALLGPGGAQEWGQLPPEESQRRLGLLAALMDADGDGAVSGPELRRWLERRLRGARGESAGRGRRRFDRDGDGRVTWEEFRGEAYGPPGGDLGGSPHADAPWRLLRDERRFRAADGDGDGALGGDELVAFLHPEDFPHMSHVVLKETMEDMDTDGDGFIQLEEYLAELHDGSEGVPAGGGPAGGAPEPPWLQREREQFLGARDRDGDGRLDPGEVGAWLSPLPPDWAGVEAAHLLHHADSDKDGQLTRAEILGQWELFVGSRATNFGEDLERPHDEL